MRVVFGGTFDPVHSGHIAMARELVSVLGIDKIYLMPCYKAVHKSDVSSSPHQRLKMLELALANFPEIEVDDREIRRSRPSYTYDSVIEIKQEIGDESLCLVMGSDTAEGLCEWFNVSQISGMANLIVLTRPETDVSDPQTNIGNYGREEAVRILGWKKLLDVEALKRTPAGGCLYLTLSQVSMSSTLVRELIKKNILPDHAVPGAVKTFICDNGLYQK